MTKRTGRRDGVRQNLRLVVSTERSLAAQYPLLSELVDHATEDLYKFEDLQEGQPKEVIGALDTAQAALNGLASALLRNRPNLTPGA